MQEEIKFWLTEGVRQSPEQFETFHIALYVTRLHCPTIPIRIAYQQGSIPNPHWKQDLFILEEYPPGQLPTADWQLGTAVPSKATDQLPTGLIQPPTDLVNLAQAINWLTKIRAQPAQWIALGYTNSIRGKWPGQEQLLPLAQWQDWIWHVKAGLPRDPRSGNLLFPRAWPQRKTARRL